MTPNLLPGNKFTPAPYLPVANSGSSGGAASVTATLPASANSTTWIEGFDVTGGGATAASIVEITVTGLQTATGTLKFEMNVLAGVTGPVNAQGGLSVTFPEPLPASAANTAIVVTLPTLGSGNTASSVTAYGFQAPSLSPAQP